jgi:catechol 2,3-dioxygenase-like lactoylglutathione lyase family enzyme
MPDRHHHTEIAMSTPQMSPASTAPVASAAPVDLKLEVIVIPVADVDRAKRFYASLGWQVDIDFTNGDVRGVQVTPPGSPTSIHFGKGLTAAAPGSALGMYLVVSNVAAARADLISRGVDVSEVYHHAGLGGPRVSGPDPEGRSYASFASFNDPDGNTWLLQEITTRFPGRGLSVDLATLTTLLREAETLHGEHGPAAPKHHWSEWYAGYLVARERGRTSEDAARDATRGIAGAPAASPA